MRSMIALATYSVAACDAARVARDLNSGNSRATLHLREQSMRSNVSKTAARQLQPDERTDQVE